MIQEMLFGSADRTSLVNRRSVGKRLRGVHSGPWLTSRYPRRRREILFISATLEEFTPAIMSPYPLGNVEFSWLLESRS
jgi:hypothetical protein